MSSLASRPSKRYQIGGSLIIGDPNYVVRQADADLYAALKAGEFCYVLNSRQMGKSSLRVRTRHRLERDGCRCTALDLTAIGSHDITPLQWYKGIASELWRGFGIAPHLKLKDWWAQHGDLTPVQCLSRLLEDVVLKFATEERIVIFIDEIDSVLGLPFSSDDFFALIRHCFNERAECPALERLTFALFGVATPGNLIRDPQRTPFNIGRAIVLQGFGAAEAAPLAQGLQGYVRDPQATLQAILQWTSGQPFLTQKLCQLACSQCLENANTCQTEDERVWVRQLVQTQIVDAWEAQDEPEHLRTIRDRLLRDESIAESVLGLYQKILSGDAVVSARGSAAEELLLSGLVCNVRGQLTVRNQIYQAVFSYEWTQQRLAELRPYTEALNDWQISGYQDDSRLLRGQALREAQTWASGKDLSPLDYQFIAASENCDRRETELILETKYLCEVETHLAQEQQTARRQRWLLAAAVLGFIMATGLGLFAFHEYRRVLANERALLSSTVRTHTASAGALLGAGQSLDAIVQAIWAAHHLQRLEEPTPELSSEVDHTLRHVFFQALEANRLENHTSDVYAVALSPDGNIIASGGRDAPIRLWRRKTGQHQLLQTKRVLRTGRTIHDLEFAADGDVLAAALETGEIELWTARGQFLRALEGHNGAVFDVDFSPDGTWLASASGDATVKLWNRADGKLRGILTGHGGEVREVAISPDGRFVATGGRDRRVRLWDVVGDRPQLVRTYPRRGGTIRGLAFSPDGEILAISGDDRKVQLWSREGTLVRQLASDTSPVQALAFGPDGRQLIAGNWEGTLKLWDHTSGILLATLTGHHDRVWNLALSKDTIVSASWDDTVRIWQLRHPVLTHFRGHGAPTISVAVSPDERLIATASDDYTVRLWKPDGTAVATLRGHTNEVYSVDFSPDGQVIASAGLDGAVELWSREGAALGTLGSLEIPIWSVRFSPDGRWLAVGASDGTIRLWQRDGAETRFFRAHPKNQISAIAFSPDDNTLATASLDGTAKLWSLDGKLLTTFVGHTAGVNGVAFSPDGSILATAGIDRVVKLWQRDGTLLQTLEGHTGEVSDIAFSPDGRLLASAGWDDTVRLWSAAGEPLAILNGHAGRVWALAFAAGGQQLLSSSDDRTAIGWDLERIVTSERLLAESCAWVQGFLATNPQITFPDTEKAQNHLCDSP